MKHEITARFVAISIICMGVVTSGAPSLPVTKTPVTPNPSYTGPTNDPHAVMGQWFQNVTNQATEYRTHEFYDNAPLAGGGSKATLAIEGYVTNIVYNNSNPFDPNRIASFDVVATIHNDTTSPPSGSWVAGTNNLMESLSTINVSTNTMLSVIMTADFATTDILPISNMGNPPYRDSAPYITATNHDFTSWYGWNSYITQDGGFYVPGWDFGSLPSGYSATRVLQFVLRDFNGGDTFMSSSDPRYPLLVASSESGSDILINRSVSLKISQWISDPAADDGSAYPTGAEGDLSNVSVFHNTISDQTQSIQLRSLSRQPSPATVYLNSTGSSGITWQILQCCTNLVSTNWINVATNMAWPEPQTNHWTNTTTSGSVNFFRIVQP